MALELELPRSVQQIPEGPGAHLVAFICFFFIALLSFTEIKFQARDRCTGRSGSTANQALRNSYAREIGSFLHATV
jgi:hypothetical protein